MTQSKDLNIQHWSTETVCEWLKGVKCITPEYIDNFQQKQINGKKLILLESSDVNEVVNGNLAAQLMIYKSIQNLLNTRHNLSKETLQGLMFYTQNRIKSLLSYSEEIINCSNRLSNSNAECLHCSRLKRDLVSNTSAMAVSYRKLVSWLIKLPFTRLSPFENFRNDINSKMKHFLKLFRRKLNDQSIVEIKLSLTDLYSCFKKMVDYCDSNCDNENGKMSVAFNCCYLEKVIIKQRFAEQQLGISLICLVDGLSTISEIEKESAADECSRLTVEDDIIAVNNQIVVGWDLSYLNQYIDESYTNFKQLSLVLRKMPKEQLITLKQMQKNPLYLANKDQNKLSTKKQHQRKHSLTEIFLADESLLYNSSDEEEDDDDEEDEEEIDSDFNSNNSASEKISTSIENQLSEADKHAKLSADNLYEKNSSHSSNIDQKSLKNKSLTSNTRNKLAKLAKKTNKSRLIKSMQNLLTYDRSRSNSNENLNSDSDNNKPAKKKSNNNNDENNSKSEIIRSLFSNKKYDLNNNNTLSKKKSSDFDQSGTPSLLNVRKVDSLKRLNLNKVDVLLDNTNTSKDTGTVSRKPPIDKRAQKAQTQKPTMISWLYKRKHPQAISNSSTSLSNMSASSKNTITPMNSNNNGSQSANNNNNQNMVRYNTYNKWKHYWCVLFKDYITFYKYQDEKTPKDFLLLKDFTIKQSGRKNGFILVDKSKQLEHEFYAETVEDFNSWNQALNELRNKQHGELLASQSSGYDTASISNNNNNEMSNSNSITSLTQSLPGSSNLNRRNNNNLQLHLSSIMDSNDDLQSSLSPTLIKNSQQQCCSSRESSRDSSPILNYPYQQEQETGFTTSESDAEYMDSSRSKRQDIIDKKAKLSKLSNSNSSAILSSVNTTATAGLINSNKKQTSCSPSSATSTSSGGAGHFVYDEDIYNDPFQSHRANSLPGSLIQACAGSLTPSNSNNKKETKHEKDNNQIVDSPKEAKIDSQPLYSSPSHQATSSTYNTSSNASTTTTNTASINLQKPLSPTSKQVSSIINSPLTSAATITQSPTLYSYPSETNSSNKSSNQHHFIFQPQKLQHQQSLPSTPPGTTQRISLKLGPKGITSINTFVTNEQKPQPVLLKTITKPSYIQSIQNSNDSANTPNRSGSPVVYRTELTIMPFNPNQSSTSTSSQSNNNSNNNNTQTSQSTSTNPPSLKKIHKF